MTLFLTCWAVANAVKASSNVHTYFIFTIYREFTAAVVWITLTVLAGGTDGVDDSVDWNDSL